MLVLFCFVFMFLPQVCDTIERLHVLLQAVSPALARRHLVRQAVGWRTCEILESATNGVLTIIVVAS